MIQFMPKSFENGVLDRQPINQGLLQNIRPRRQAHRGKQALSKQHYLQVTLRATVADPLGLLKQDCFLRILDRRDDVLRHFGDRLSPQNGSFTS